ncbi:methyl-accepting chemotaxis protein [Qipengyuania nanhaisediminis]|uniref:methyl-accepting chemotaxis protein n=1 Tax=Qipengyuania nanhaisediminis TaxID=604088 RepID=UPI0038B27CCC
MTSLDHDFDTGHAAPHSPPADAAAVLSASAGPAVIDGDDWEPRSNWLARLSLAGKLNLAVFGSTFVLVAVTLVMLAGTHVFSSRGETQANLSYIEVRSNNAAIAMVDVVDALEAAEAAGSAQDRATALAEAEGASARVHDILHDQFTFSAEKMPAHVAPVIGEFRSELADLQTRIAPGNSGQADLAALHADARALYQGIAAFAIDFHAEASAGAERLFAQIATFFMVFVALTVIGIALALFASRRVVSDIDGMIRAITGSMEKVAAGHTDTAIPGRKRSDEIGAMARSLAVFRESTLKLREMAAARAADAERELENQQSRGDRMRAFGMEKAQLLEGLADGFEVSVGELITAVSAASQQLKATSRQMVELADGSSQQAGSASEAMKEATSNVTAAAAATDEFALSIGEISRQAAASAELARDASTMVSTANSKMTDLSQAAVEIGEIVELIQTIAQRTNLLALNASIEAARGGEAGRGFAVVASEVKELAMQTGNAASNVTEKITAMQDSTRSSAGDLTSIVDRIGELEQTAVMIASAVDQQSVSAGELARNIDTVASGSAQVDQRLKALREASEETGTAADDVVASANALGETADNLREKAGRFISDVRRSARELDASKTPG